MVDTSLVASGKTPSVDQKIVSDLRDKKFVNYLFTRLVARKRRFVGIDFKYSFFDTCYLRDCQFDSCDFTGARFVNSNLGGSKFSGCKFDYAYFEKTLLEPAILDTE